MKTQQVLKNPVAKKMYDLKFKTSLAAVGGRCKEARSLHKEYAKLAVDNFTLAMQVPPPIKGSIPLFSRAGLNTLKYIIYNAFSRKTPEEKQLVKMTDDYKNSLYLETLQ